MNTKEITTKLNEIFFEEQHRIVFWHDSEAKFIETISDLSIPDITLLRMDEIGFFSLKKRFEAYCNDLFLFDTRHRQFLAVTDKLELLAWDILKSLRKAVSDCYEACFLDRLAANWSSLVAVDNDLFLNPWNISGIKRPNTEKELGRSIISDRTTWILKSN